MKAGSGLLRDRDFLLFFTARTASLTGNVIAPLGLAFAVLALPDGTPTQLGLLLSIRTIAQLALVLLGGVLADRFPRRRLIVIGDVTAGCSQAVTAALFLTGTVPMGMLAVLAAVNGASSALSQPAGIALVPEIVRTELIQSANALLRLAANVARVGGAFVGGVLVAATSPGWALAADAATFLLSAALLLRVRPRTSPGTGGADGAEKRAGYLAELRAGWAEFRALPWMWPVVAQFAVVNACFGGAVMVLGPTVAQRDWGGPFAWSVVLAAHSAGFVAGSLIALRLRPRRPLRAAVLATFGFAPSYVLLATGAPVWLTAASMLLAGACLDVFEVLWRTAVHTHVPAQAMARVSSYDSLASFVCTPLGLAVAGPAAAQFGTRATLLCSGFLVLLATALALVSHAVRTLRSAVPGTPPAPEAHASEEKGPTARRTGSAD
ncbi:MFS transporter [Streptomyces sp. NPDC058374]|uniref:MFS transporter n=1 Tax=Streptomyces sp. NPDC058374 TaxID=3346466 RepID=UPI003645FBDB